MVYQVEIFSDGARRTVAVDAPNAEDAAKKVVSRLRSGIVTSVRPAGSRSPGSLFVLPGARAGPRDLELACRQLQALIGAGVTTLDAVETVASQAGKKSLREALRRAADNIREGFSLSDAFRTSPRVFPEVFVRVMEAAEETGAFEESLATLANHFERETKFRERLRQAMAYPALVACLAVAVALGLFLFVVPKFAGLLADAGIPLPLITRIVMGFAAHAKPVFGGLAVLFVLGTPLFRMLWQQQGFRTALESALARVPVMGRLLTRAAAARACRTVALLARVGVPLVRALEVAEGVAVFSGLRYDLQIARTVLRGGGSLARALSGSRWFPQVGVKMAAVGEESGRLPEMLEQAASLFESEVDMLMQRLPTAVEVALMVCVGGLVLVVLLSMFLPIFSVYQTVK